MSGTLRIEITGVALIHPFSENNKNYWKVWFPFDDENLEMGIEYCHDVQLKIYENKTSNEDEPPNFSTKLVGNERKITLDLGNTLINENSLNMKVFNFNSRKAHGRGGIKKKQSTQFVELILPKVNFDYELAKFKNGVTEKYVLLESVGNRYKIRQAPFEIAKSIHVTLPSYSPFSIIEEGLTKPIFQSAEHDNSKKYDIIFDNDCHITDIKVNDFRMIYDWIIEDNAPSNKKKYELEWVPEFIIDDLSESEVDFIDKMQFRIAQYIGRQEVKEHGTINKTYPCFVYQAEEIS